MTAVNDFTAEHREFPLHALPSTVRRYVDGIASAMNCDPAYSALPALAAMGAAIGSTHVVRNVSYLLH